MNSFETWLKQNDRELFEQITQENLDENWKKWAARAALGAAAMSPFTANAPGVDAAPQKQQMRPYQVQQQTLKGDELAQTNYMKDLDRMKQGQAPDNQVSQHPVEINSVTKVFERQMGQIAEDALIEVIETKNVDQGTMVVMEFSGTIMAFSQEEANQKAAQMLQKVAQNAGIQVNNLQVLGENAARFRVKIRFNVMQG